MFFPLAQSVRFLWFVPAEVPAQPVRYGAGLLRPVRQIAFALQLRDERFELGVPCCPEAAGQGFAQEAVERQLQVAALAHGVGADAPAVVGEARPRMG